MLQAVSLTSEIRLTIVRETEPFWDDVPIAYNLAF